jgi:superfamily II DNA or RNA helicase
MPRHYPSEPRVRRVIDALAQRFLDLGSVNALAEALSDQVADGQRIYANRVHGLLSGDPTRSINSATLEAIEQALASMPDPTSGGEAETLLRQAIAAELAMTPNVEEALRRVADHEDVPFGVVLWIAQALPAAPSPLPAQDTAPDWSWQEEAIRRCLQSLRKAPGQKVGLVVPTGGGKTKISLRLILRWLAESDREDSVALWVTHRSRLDLQARRALQEVLGDEDVLPEAATTLFADRVRFSMISAAASAIEELGDRLTLIVVDEAHHAAAPSYEPIVAQQVVPALFLTATPNRADALPIGIDEIAFTISYRELFERHCVIEPIFDPPVNMYGIDWKAEGGLDQLADYLLERAEADFRKTLVAVSKQEHAERLHEAVSDLLDARPHHPLQPNDVLYVHGAGTSASASPSDALDEFAARPRGILMATGQLVGEGYDDPGIDAAVVTYPSSSISHLMQVAGRALRYAPGKTLAHVVQVRDSNLAYHFEQRWLYQDISDELRPDLIDLEYTSLDDLLDLVGTELRVHRVPDSVQERILHEVGRVTEPGGINLMLTGIPYYGDDADFEAQARWGAILVTPEERQRFLHIFNNLSYRTGDLKEQVAYLQQFIAPDNRAGSVWKSYVDLVEATEYARRELEGTPYGNTGRRRYEPNLSSTWLRYVTCTFVPKVPPELEAFLADAVNRESILSAFVASPGEWAAATSLELPLSGSWAYLLTRDQATWLIEQRDALTRRLKEAPPDDGFDEVVRWRGSLTHVPVPIRLLDEASQLTRPERFGRRYLPLS